LDYHPFFFFLALTVTVMFGRKHVMPSRCLNCIYRAARTNDSIGLGALFYAQSCPLDPDLKREDGLGQAVGEAHRRYTNFINAQGRWTRHLFEGRFASVAMDEAHFTSAMKSLLEVTSTCCCCASVPGISGSANVTQTHLANPLHRRWNQSASRR
jgi:hypothetical protein